MKTFLPEIYRPFMEVFCALFQVSHALYKPMVVSATVNQPGHIVLPEHECELKVAWRWNAATNDRG